MLPEGSSFSSQNSVIGPYPKPVQSSSHIHNLSIILSSYLYPLSVLFPYSERLGFEHIQNNT